MAAGASTLPVAVIIAAHNRAEWVGDAVASALAQRPTPPAEVIVVDDASTDDTVAVARAAGARLISHDSNRGAATARNTGASSTTQPWIAPLDSDDRWLPHMLASLWPVRGEYGFVAGSSIAVDGDETPLSYGGPLTDGPVQLHSPAPLVFPENFIPASGVLIRRETFVAAGAYRTTLRSAEDLDLWMRMLALRPGLCVPDVVMRYRVHPGQKSRGAAASRDAVLEIVDAYRNAPWFAPELVERRRAVMAWDELREAFGERRLSRALRVGGWIAGRGLRRRALVTALSRRRRARRQVRRLGAGAIALR
jgi:glycosyltransferase involved in cell wall biosynthesis